LEASALTCLGLAQEGLDDLPTAAESYWQALFLWQEVDLPNRALEPWAGLARVALALDAPAKGLGQGLAQARAHVDEIMAALESGLEEGLPGVSDPFRVYLTCIQVLAASHDDRGTELVRTAYRLLEERATTIVEEAQRRAFWEIPSHRAIQRSATGEG
jgi:hypothetical protein